MPVPKHTIGDVLPPFIGDPTGAERAPYRVTMHDLATAFATSTERTAILRGLVKFREALRRALPVDGAFQWIDGSFIDRLHDREPRDVDVVTFVFEPSFDPMEEPDRAAALDLLADHDAVKETYRCDTYWVDLGASSPDQLISKALYWYGLFSHQRDTFVWRGLLRLELDEDDASALELLDALDRERALAEPTFTQDNE